MNRLTIGIDIGGTKIAGGLVNRRGEVVGRIGSPTNAWEGGPSIMSRALDTAARLLDEASDEVEGVGIASGGLIDPRTGIVLHATDLLPGWTGMDIAGTFSEKLGVPARAINDASAAALGEGVFGAAKDVDDFVLLTLGTGVGGGIFSGGRLVIGAQGVAGAIGHMTIDCDGRPCNCGSRGCLEAYASGTAIADRALSLAAERGIASSLVRDIEEDRSSGARLISEAAASGDGFATEIITEAGEYLGRGIANLVNLLNPSVVVIGGSVAEMGDLLLDPARRTAREYALKGPSDVRIVRAKLGNDAGILGAASLLWDD